MKNVVKVDNISSTKHLLGCAEKKFQLQADLNGRPSEQRISMHWDQ
jgi:hypothetical protein